MTETRPNAKMRQLNQSVTGVEAELAKNAWKSNSNWKERLGPGASCYVDLWIVASSNFVTQTLKPSRVPTAMTRTSRSCNSCNKSLQRLTRNAMKGDLQAIRADAELQQFHAVQRERKY